MKHDKDCPKRGDETADCTCDAEVLAQVSRQRPSPAELMRQAKSRGLISQGLQYP